MKKMNEYQKEIRVTAKSESNYITFRNDEDQYFINVSGHLHSVCSRCVCIWDMRTVVRSKIAPGNVRKSWKNIKRGD